MAGGSGAGGTGSGGRGFFNKLAALLLGGGAVAITIIFGPWGPRDGDPKPTPAPSQAPAPVETPGQQLPATASAANPTRGQSGPPPTPSGLKVGPDEAVITLITYGLPGRFSPTLQGSNDTLRGEFREQCTPDVQFPNPCVIDYVVKRGANVTLHAGDSRAGYWPVLKSVRGTGCSLDTSSVGRDQECTFTVGGDATYEAKYFGDQGDGEFIYPACPKNPGNNPPAWLKC